MNHTDSMYKPGWTVVLPVVGPTTAQSLADIAKTLKEKL